MTLSDEFNPWLTEHLVCPRDRGALEAADGWLTCAAGHRYPLARGVPVMLLDDVSVTHDVMHQSLALARDESFLERQDREVPAGTVDPYVQQVVGATCGLMYVPLIDRLEAYPIPEFRIQPDHPGGVFLEIGCNWGRWCLSAARKGQFVVGVDPSLEALLAARRVARQLGLRATYVVADGRHLPFKDGSITTAFSYSVFQHLSKDDVRSCLREVARTLLDGGTCPVQLPNRYGLRSTDNRIRMAFRPPRLFDVRYWTPSELRATFAELVGPTSIAVDGFFTVNPQPADAPLLARRSWRAATGWSSRPRSACAGPVSGGRGSRALRTASSSSRSAPAG